MRAAATANSTALLQGYSPRPDRMLPVLAFWLLWLAAWGLLAGARAREALALAAQLWIAHAAAWWALAGLRTWLGNEANWYAIVAAVTAGALGGALLGLPWASDFALTRLASWEWDARRALLPFAFAVVMHLVPMAIRWGEARRHRARLLRASQASALADLERQVAIAELKTLQAQVEPHFLFNTLASVQRLVRQDPTLAERMLERLHTYLRLAVPSMRMSDSTVALEVTLAGAYLDIMVVRFGERLKHHLDLPVELASEPMPPMMLLSLVENAIKHGIEPVPEGGSVWVRVRKKGGGMEVTVEDDGKGLQASGAEAGSGTGLSNISERLRALYGVEAGLSVREREECGICAVLSWPLASRAAAGS